MIIGFYFITFIFSVVLLLKCLISNKNIDTRFVMLFIAIVLNCMGRYFLSVSESLEMAIWANKILYVGGIYAPLLSVLLVARMCDINIPKVISYGTTCFSTIILVLVFTIGRSDIYYKAVHLENNGKYSYLVKTYGPAHNLYPMLMIVYAIVMVLFIVKAYKKRKYISFKIVSVMGVTCVAVIVFYIIERAFKSETSLLAIGYLIGIGMMIKYYNYINMFDMTSNIATTVEKMKEYGYIVFDINGCYINSNLLIKEIFPEVNTWEINKKIKPTNSYMYTEIVKYFIDNADENPESKIININDSYYQVVLRHIEYAQKGIVGYLLEFTDRTIEEKYYNTIKEYNNNLEAEVIKKTEHIMKIKDMMVLGMADMVENRDNNTGGHIKRTSKVIEIFANKLLCYKNNNLNNNFLELVVKAAPMHDLGKIAIEDAILRKPGKYTDEEFNEMKRHTTEGARIVENLLNDIEDDEVVKIAKNIAFYHHEKWNGMGYPTQISGEDIPMEARIMALADVFDALVSKRCYKDAYSYDKAFEIIENSSGTHFDPQLVKIFLECRDDLEKLYSTI